MRAQDTSVRWCMPNKRWCGKMLDAHSTAIPPLRCAAAQWPPDHLSSALSFSRTWSIANLISHIYFIALSPLEKLYCLCVYTWVRNPMRTKTKHLRTAKLSQRKHCSRAYTAVWMNNSVTKISHQSRRHRGAQPPPNWNRKHFKLVQFL